jgi:hypothetical protein
VHLQLYPVVQGALERIRTKIKIKTRTLAVEMMVIPAATRGGVVMMAEAAAEMMAALAAVTAATPAAMRVLATVVIVALVTVAILEVPVVAMIMGEVKEIMKVLTRNMITRQKSMISLRVVLSAR